MPTRLLPSRVAPPAGIRLFFLYPHEVGSYEGVARGQLEEDRRRALWDFLEGRSDAPLGLGQIGAAILQPVLDPFLGEPGLSLGRKAVDVGHGSPIHLKADLAVIGGGASVRHTTLGRFVGSLIARDADMTRDPAVFDGDACSAERGFIPVGPKCNPLARAFIVIAEA
jgi:hypothetical protein